jgi:hypothetical protein
MLMRNKMQRWKFSSRRTGVKYTVAEVNEYINNDLSDDQGDLVINGMTSTSPFEIRVNYLLNNEVPADLKDKFHVGNCEFVAAKYANRHFEVLYKAEAFFVLTKFTILNKYLGIRLRHLHVLDVPFHIVHSQPDSWWKKWFQTVDSRTKFQNALDHTTLYKRQTGRLIRR